MEVQLKKYETAPYFFLLNQNFTCDCLLISVFYLDLTEFAGQFWTSKQNNFTFWSGKSTNNPMSSFGLIEKNMELSHIY